MISDRKTTKMRKQKWDEKQLYRYFKRQTGEISHEKTRMCIQKGNFWREIETLLITAQNNAIRTNFVKLKIDNTQRNSKCSLCRERDETINHIVRESSKVAQEYKTRLD